MTLFLESFLPPLCSFLSPLPLLQLCTNHFATYFCLIYTALVFTQFVNDEFMRLLIVRFCFCYYALKLRSPKDVSSDFLPASYPSLGASVLCSSTVITLFKELAGILGVSTLYY